MEVEGYDGIPEDLIQLHKTRPTQIAYLKSRRELFPPLDGFDDNLIKIQIQGGANEVWIPNETRIWFRIAIYREDADEFVAEADEDSRVALINGIGSAFFKNVAVRLNNQPITQEDNHYGFKADIENRIYTPIEEKKRLRKMGYLEDDKLFDAYGNPFHDIIPAGGGGVERADGSVQIKQRRAWTVGHSFEVCSRIFSPLFDQDKPLMPGTIVDIDFQKNHEDLLLLVNEGDGQLRLLDFAVEAQFNTIDTEILQEILEATTPKNPLVYPLRVSNMKSFSKGGKFV